MLCLRHCRTESHTHQKSSWSWNSELAGDRVGGESWHLLLTSEEPGEPGADWVMPAPPAQILQIRRWGLAKQFKACCSVFKMPVAGWPQKDKGAMSLNLWFYYWSCDLKNKIIPHKESIPHKEMAGISQKEKFLNCPIAMRKYNHFSGFASGEGKCLLYINGTCEEDPQPLGRKLKNARKGNTIITLRT